MSEKKSHNHEEETEHDQPYGAVFVTTFLLITILVMWFGVYALNFVRG